MSETESLSLMPQISVLTAMVGHDARLAHLVSALQGQLLPPDELVIVHMHDAPAPAPEGLPFAITEIFAEEGTMPLAAARNAAAAKASGEVLIFLDADVIPSPALVMAFTLELQARDACLIGEALHLAEEARAGAGATDLDRAGRRHPGLSAPPETGIRAEPDEAALRGAAFALRRSTFRRSGGLDERLSGYGAEETDFARTLAARKIPLARCGGARAYHQPRPVFRPPLHHFDDIVRNARIFHDKWGDWPMEEWLGELEAADYILRRGGVLDVLRRPDPEEIAAAKAPNAARLG